MSEVTHVVLGPDTHGVARHALGVTTGRPRVRVRDGAHLDELLEVLPARLHLHVTDHLLGDEPAEAADRLARLSVSRCLTLTLHDVPQRAEGVERWVRRASAYQRMTATAAGVVVASEHERALLEACGAETDRVAVIPLPLDSQARHSSRPTGGRPVRVGVLGWLYPGKGHEQVLRAAATLGEAEVTAIGAVSPGHEDLAESLSRLARSLGIRWHVTGFVPDDELPRMIGGVDVPVAAHAHVSASGSIGTWLEHGRRPVVLDGEWVRELDARLPGAVTITTPEQLGSTLGDAVRDTTATMLPSDLRLEPSTSQAGELLDTATAGVEGEHGLTSLVVPWCADQAGLDRLLAALELQRLDGTRLEVLICDDGSPDEPVVGERPYPVRVLRQDDRGFRASAARDLGLRAARGDVTLFMDSDMVPEPGYVAAMRASVTAAGADRLVVGRRRHAALEGWSAQAVRDWLLDRGSAPAELPEPGWLHDAYAATHDLRDADERSYRFVISAVLGGRTWQLRRIGGFDPTFVGYGGEDWELAHRAWHCGLDLRHAPDAVAWHDGPDFAGREDDARRSIKNAEALAVADRVPDARARDPRLRWAVPQEALRLHGDPSAAQVAAVAGDLLTGRDAALWVQAWHERLLPDDRVHAGAVPASVLRRCHRVVEVRLDPVTHAAQLISRSSRAFTRGEDDRQTARVSMPVVEGEPDLEAGWGWGAW